MQEQSRFSSFLYLTLNHVYSYKYVSALLTMLIHLLHFMCLKMIPDIKKIEKSFHFSRFASYATFLKRNLYQLFKLRILESYFGLFTNEQLSLQCCLEMKNKTFKGLSNIPVQVIFCNLCVRK